MTDPLISAADLAARLEDVQILDATYFMPAEPDRARAEFAAGHLPGARLFEIDEIADHTSPLPHMMPDAQAFGAAMAALGIDGTREVVVYDRSETHFSAPRVWFTLRLFGLTARVLDGGYAAWVAGGHPVETGPGATTTAEPRDWQAKPGRVLAARDVSDTAQTGASILDARSRDRFAGTAPEPRPGLSSGHMPLSACVPFTDLTGPNGRFATPDRLRALFGSEVGDDPVVTCGSGMTACVLALGLARLGVDARLYDGSWADWGTGAHGPILTDA